MGSGGLRGLQNRWLHNSQRQVRFLPLPVFCCRCVAVLSVLFVAAFSTDAEKLAYVSKKVWSIDYILDNRVVLSCLEEKTYDFLLFDFEASGEYPPNILKEIYEQYPIVPIFLLSHQHCNFVEQAAFATNMVLGCFSIPYEFNILHNTIKNTLEGKNSRIIDMYDIDPVTAPLYTKLQGQSIEIQMVRNFILQAAQQSSHVLLYGESGSGKEVVASLIHQYSKNRHGKYLPVNTTCIAEDLAESLLFGSCKGAYTGATDKEGFFSEANEGTLFFDEIENLTLNLQAKLLRVIETHEYYKLGGTKKYSSDFRLICATNRDLQDMVDQGLFRLDLFYRLDVSHLVIPPLRQHKEDIGLLAYNYLKQTKKYLSQEALHLLHKHNWPGNVRELFNCLERAVFAAKTSPVLFPQHFDI